MRLKLLSLSMLVFALLLLDLPALAQRGGRGGGGMQRGGGGGMQRGGGGGGMQRGGGGGGGMQRGGGGGGMQRGGGGAQPGGFGGGMSARGPEGGRSGGNPSMGPYGHGGAGGAGAGMGAGGAGRPGMGAGGAGRPGMGEGGAGRPGVGAGGAGGTATAGVPARGAGVPPGTATATTARPGVGTGGAGGPASGVGVRPGAGAGAPGVGAGGVGGPYSGVGVRPGAGAGAAGVPGADYAARRPGTYYAGNNALVAQRNTVVAGAAAYPAYNPAMYAAYAGAWQPTNLMSPSLYANPGYGAVAGMTGMPAQPAAYDYGSNVVAQPNAVYVNGDPVGTPQQYADQAGQIAAAGASQATANDQWLPLGIFAMVEPDQTQPKDLFQLAMNKQGVIRGNYHNLQTNETTPLAGSVDRTTQRAAWTIGGDKTPIYETGVANLTSDQTTMLVHTPDGQQQQFTLVRLPEPQQGGPGSTPAQP